MFEIFTDSACNLTDKLIERDNVIIIPFYYSVDGAEHPCYDTANPFKGEAFYNLMRENETVKTSMVNCDTFIKAFEPKLISGRDVLYIGISSGLSGTYNAAVMACEELSEKYPERRLVTVDSLSGSLGEGLLVHYAALMRAKLKSIDETAERINMLALKMRSHFTPATLLYLKRGGRISTATALVGAALGIKPLIRSENNGKILMYDKIRGRRAAMDRLISEITAEVDTTKRQIAGIAHADCKQDADYLAERIRKLPFISDIIINMMEPVTGIHGGPGMLALFYIAETK